MPHESFPLIDVSDIIRLVGQAAFQRGRDYARLGAVLKTEWDGPTRRVLGTVQGSGTVPYRCSVTLVAAREPSNGVSYQAIGGSTSRPTSSTCSCPMAFDCKHIAATLIANNSLHIRALNNAAVAPARAFDRNPVSALETPAWKTAVAVFASDDKAGGAASGTQTDVGGYRPIGYRPAPPTPMGLLFELREQTPRTPDRWRGPSAKTATKTIEGGPAQIFRLGVRPIVKSPTGNWVRGNITWNSLNYLANRLNLRPEQLRWFAQFAALHRATREVFTTQEPDWLYLDDFLSPLFWQLLEQAETIGITLVGGKKDASVVVAGIAELSIDVSAADPDPVLPSEPVAPPEQLASSELDAAPDAPATDLLLSPTLTIDGAPREFGRSGTIGDHGIYLWSLAPRTVFTLAPTAKSLNPHERSLLEAPQTVTVPASDVPEFLTEYYPLLRRSVSVTSRDESVTFPKPIPPVLVLTATFSSKHRLSLAWGWELTVGTTHTLVSINRPHSQVDAELERETLGVVKAVLQTASIPSVTNLQGLDAAEFCAGPLPAIEQIEGVRVDIVGKQPNYLELTESPELTITTVETPHRDWFDLGVMITVSGRKVPLATLIKALSAGKKKLLLADNSFLSLDHPAFETLHQLIEEASALAEWETGLRISRYQASLWSDFEDLADETIQAQTWRSAVDGLLTHGNSTGKGRGTGNSAGTPTGTAADTPVHSVALPIGVLATLRPYQQAGFDWLVFLWRHELGGILADDMGLGKTLQTLALIAHAVEVAIIELPDAPAPPFLVVAPTSVVSNWVTEAARFTPGLQVRAITATESKNRETIADAALGADIVITSYALFRLDFPAYQAQSWAGLILDEAQFVKNPASRAHKCAVELDAPFKLAITGTPMENSLLDLWSLFAVVAPGLFPSHRRFTEEYLRPIGRGSAVADAIAAEDGLQTADELSARARADAAAARVAVVTAANSVALLAKLRRRIRPLMMRRTKELVATDLPAKQEQVLRVELAPAHRKLYDTFLQRERQKLLGLIQDLDKNRFIVFRSLTLLRMLSLDASLVDEKYADIASSKLDVLFEQLEDVVAEGHRSLIFSQFTSFLKKAADRLDAQGIAYEYLDGSTLKRASVISRFKTGTAPVFLISLKAGGFGLNLTEADYVFLLDPWWNPATETQAVDRTHRIGQTKNVNVYRLVATNTIEEKVMALKEQKAKLFDAVMDDGAVFSSALTADDIRGLLEA